MLKIKNHKKGLIASTLVDFYSYIAFAIVIIIFYFLFQLIANPYPRGIMAAESNTEANTLLLNYLRTPVTVNVNGMDQKITMADLVRLWYLDKQSHEKQFRDETESIINKWEYEYIPPQKNNIVIRAYRLSIAKKDQYGGYIDHTKPISSSSYEDGFCTREPGTLFCIRFLAYLPISDSEFVYISLIDSNKAK